MSNVFKTKATAGQQFECAPPGNHPAVLVALVDLGTHTEEFEDKEKKTTRTSDVRKVLLVWELVTCPMTGKVSENHVVGKDYNLSGNPKAGVRKMLESWRGKPYADGEEMDLSVTLGKPCLINLSNGKSSKDRTFAKVEAITAVPKGMAVPAAKRKPLSWSIDDGEFPAALSWLPRVYGEEVKSVVARCNERKGAPSKPLTEEGEAPEADAPAPVLAGTQADETPF